MGNYSKATYTEKKDDKLDEEWHTVFCAMSRCHVFFTKDEDEATKKARDLNLEERFSNAKYNMTGIGFVAKVITKERAESLWERRELFGEWEGRNSSLTMEERAFIGAVWDDQQGDTSFNDAFHNIRMERVDVSKVTYKNSCPKCKRRSEVRKYVGTNDKYNFCPFCFSTFNGEESKEKKALIEDAAKGDVGETKDNL
jgi:hypothetical protein